MAMSAAAQSGSQIAMSPMTNTTNATRNRKKKISATPSHIAARRLARMISVIS